MFTCGRLPIWAIKIDEYIHYANKAIQITTRDMSSCQCCQMGSTRDYTTRIRNSRLHLFRPDENMLNVCHWKPISTTTSSLVWVATVRAKTRLMVNQAYVFLANHNWESNKTIVNSPVVHEPSKLTGKTSLTNEQRTRKLGLIQQRQREVMLFSLWCRHCVDWERVLHRDSRV